MEIKGLKSCVVLLIYSQLSAADFEFNVTIHSYNNSNGYVITESGERRRCDSNCPVGSCCDSQFTFCLRAYGGSMDSNALNCPLSGGSPLTSGILDNTDLRSFEMGSLSLGGEVLNNPLVFTGDSWPGGFLLYILIEEDDVDSKEIIDRIYIEQQLSPGTRTAMMNYIGNFSNAQMMLSFSVECVNGFNGSDCSMSNLSPTTTTKVFRNSTVPIDIHVIAGVLAGTYLVVATLVVLGVCACCFCFGRKRSQLYKAAPSEYCINTDQDELCGQTNPCYCGDQPGDIDEVIAGSDLEYESGDFNFKIDAV